jgi:integrase
VVATTAIDWAKLAQAEPQRHYRLQTVIRFAQFMAAEDSRHQIPPTGIFRSHRQRPIPYIFGETEIEQLLRAARQLGPSGSLRPHTYSTFFGLLAVTGMRVSEARALHLQDVTVDGLLIRQTKFHKSRLLPVHETTREALEHYLSSPACGWSRSAPLCYTSTWQALTHGGDANLLPRAPSGRDSS